jgi:uncharacterized protein (DUF1697 family)
MLARELEHLGAVNIGAAGTFVFQQPIGRRRLRQEIARRLPFDAEIVMCDGRETVALLSTTVFDRYARQPDVVRFVSVLSRRSVLAPRLPVTLPARGRWLLKVLARDGRFVLGMYRRQMKVIGYLGSLDRLFGVPATTRNWNTMTTIANVVGNRTGSK